MNHDLAPLTRCDELSRESRELEYCHCLVLRPPFIFDGFWPHRIADQLSNTSLLLDVNE